MATIGVSCSLFTSITICVCLNNSGTEVSFFSECILISMAQEIHGASTRNTKRKVNA